MTQAGQNNDASPARAAGLENPAAAIFTAGEPGL